MANGATESVKSANAWLSVFDRISKTPTWIQIAGTGGTYTLGGLVLQSLRSAPVWAWILYVLSALGVVALFGAFSAIATLASKLDSFSAQLSTAISSINELMEAKNVDERKHLRSLVERWRMLVSELAQEIPKSASYVEASKVIQSHLHFASLESCLSEHTLSNIYSENITTRAFIVGHTGSVLHPLLTEIKEDIAEFEKSHGLLGLRDS